MGIPSFNEPWIPERYTVLDYVLAKRRWRNTVLDVEARPQIALNSIQKESDHAIVVAKIRVKLKKCAKSTEKENTERYRKPAPDQKRHYNAVIYEHVRHVNPEASLEQRIEDFTNTMKKAAQEKLTKIEREQKQSYITEETWNLIKERQNHEKMEIS